VTEPIIITYITDLQLFGPAIDRREVGPLPPGDQHYLVVFLAGTLPLVYR
jgi:hypothetical protein